MKNKNYHFTSQSGRFFTRRFGPVVCLAISVVLSIGIITWTTPCMSADWNTSKYTDKVAKPSFQDIQLLTNTFSIIKSVSMDEKAKNDLLFSALNGMTRAIDNYSFFISPELMPSFLEMMKGKYIGTGIHIAKTDGDVLEVVSTFPDGPAYKAGIKAKDKIIKIDGMPVNNMRPVEIFKFVGGTDFAAGTRTTLSIIPNGSDQLYDVVLIREVIEVDRITSRMLSQQYGYIQLTGFRNDTAKNFQTVVDNLIHHNRLGLNGLIIDLRNNPGGDMEACYKLVRLFIRDGLITSMQSNYPELRVEIRAQQDSIYTFPCVILVNESSASASELFAGAMKFHKRATLIGTPTFGKRSFQSFIPLANDMGLYITVGKFSLPDGTSIEGKGVMPDIRLASGIQESEIISKAIEVFQTTHN